MLNREPPATSDGPGLFPSLGEHALSSSLSPSGAATPRQVWDQLSEQDRRRALDEMDPADVRSMAASMPAIEQAKGILMGCYGIDPATAFAVLTRSSSAKNMKLRDLAMLVVEAASSHATTSHAAVGQAGPVQSPGSTPCGRVHLLLQPSHTDEEHRP